MKLLKLPFKFIGATFAACGLIIVFIADSINEGFRNFIDDHYTTKYEREKNDERKSD